MLLRRGYFEKTQPVAKKQAKNHIINKQHNIIKMVRQRKALEAIYKPCRLMDWSRTACASNGGQGVLAQKRIQRALNKNGNNQTHPQQAPTKSNRFGK
jgi:hypothetical protein